MANDLLLEAGQLLCHLEPVCFDPLKLHLHHLNLIIKVADTLLDFLYFCHGFVKVSRLRIQNRTTFLSHFRLELGHKVWNVLLHNCSMQGNSIFLLCLYLLADAVSKFA